jgi:DNA invertase Pin-like site-specific DNA recombinase
MTSYGYARVSSKGQSFDGQVEALKAAGCDQVLSEKFSGKAAADRKQLQAMLRKVGESDTIVVTKLDRFARSTRDLLNMLHELGQRGVAFRSLGEAWCDTTTAYGKLLTTILGGVAEFERELIKGRCEEGRTRARAEGRPLGRRHALDPHQRQKAREMLQAGHGQRSVARLFGVGHGTIARIAAAASIGM